MEKKINVLVSPLDWGIGHATRCVPVIDVLLAHECNVILASNGRALAFLQKEYPKIESIKITAFNINYPQKGFFFFLKMLGYLPRIISSIYKEHQALRAIVKKYDIDLIISDNRYGLWHKHIPSVIITHQLMMKAPRGLSVFEWPLHKIILSLIKKHSECWVPDFDGPHNLSGDLSHKYKKTKNTFFIGPLSRFEKCSAVPSPPKYDILFLLSGPEPQRTMLENIILRQIETLSVKAALLRGLPNKDDKMQTKNGLDIYAHLPGNKLQELIEKSEFVIARAGYSTIMDLAVLNAKALLIPTPGQTEQIYLSKYLSKKKYILSFEQHQFKLKEALRALKEVSLKEWGTQNKNPVLNQRINYFVEKLSIKN